MCDFCFERPGEYRAIGSEHDDEGLMACAECMEPDPVTGYERWLVIARGRDLMQAMYCKVCADRWRATLLERQEPYFTDGDEAMCEGDCSGHQRGQAWEPAAQVTQTQA